MSGYCVGYFTKKRTKYHIEAKRLRHVDYNSNLHAIRVLLWCEIIFAEEDEYHLFYRRVSSFTKRIFSDQSSQKSENMKSKESFYYFLQAYLNKSFNVTVFWNILLYWLFANPNVVTRTGCIAIRTLFATRNALTRLSISS